MSHTAAQWHYIDATGQRGPVATAEMAALVRAGTVRADTMVWGPGMADWQPFARSPLAREIPLPGAASAYPPPGYPPPGYPPAGYAQPGYAPPGGSPSGADGFQGAIRTCLAKFATFDGRARRPEYWWFVLFVILAQIVLGMIDGAIWGALFGMWGMSPLSWLFGIATILPGLAVSVRRLHDTDKSAWWLLIVLVPVVGPVVLLVFMCLPGTQGPNRFG
jgi:uncharacterized membrane protein YhaH (DUF805 family)